MKKLIIIMLIAAPLLSFSQGKGVPSRSQSKIEQEKYSFNQPREFALIEKIQDEAKFTITATLKSKNSKANIQMEFDTMLEALNTLGSMGFQLKTSETYQIRLNQYNIFYLERVVEQETERISN